MELRQLRHFLALAQEMHFGRAARHLNISQPALSASIARLEKEFGVRLFERDSKNVRITLAGQLMLRSAGETLSQADRTRSFSRALSAGQVGRLEIGFHAAGLGHGVKEVLLECRRQLPQIEILMREFTTPKQTELLRSGRLDAGLVGTPQPPAGMEHIEIFEDSFVLCLPPGHPLARHKAIDIAWLRDEPFVLPSPERAPITHDQLVGLCASAGFYPQISFESDSLTSTVQLVASGVGVGLVLQSLAEFGTPGPTFVPLSRPLPNWYWYFVWNAERVAPGLQALIDRIGEFAASLRSPRSRRGK